ncbi:hypothetical protein D043_2430B, partial [Vibrio parahaemolyticus EKP-021]
SSFDLPSFVISYTLWRKS